MRISTTAKICFAVVNLREAKILCHTPHFRSPIADERKTIKVRESVTCFGLELGYSLKSDAFSGQKPSLHIDFPCGKECQMTKWEYTNLLILQSGDKWRFDYKGHQYSVNELTRIMNEIGQEGWELVNTVAGNMGTSYIHFGSYLLFFKRSTN